MAIRRGREPGSYVVEFTERGERVFRRLPKATTLAQAKAYETKLRREIFDRVGLGRRPEVTLAEAIGSWLGSNRRKNQRQAVSEARQWEPFVSGRLLREAPEVAQEALTAWAGSASIRKLARKTISATGPHEWPSGSGGSKLSTVRNALPSGGAAYGTAAPRRQARSATINRRLALLKAVCKHAYKQGYPENLSGRITLLKEDNKREVYLTRAQVTTLASASPSQRTKAAILLAAFTGLRASELIALGTGKFSEDSLTVSKSKTGKPRVVPVPLSARRYLRALPLGLSYWQLHKEFSRAREKAGMPHVQFHDLRHTCASWLINAGVDLYTVGKILGHSGPQTTARYAHLSTQTLERAMARLK